MIIVRVIVFEGSKEALDEQMSMSKPDGISSIMRVIDQTATLTITTIVDERKQKPLTWKEEDPWK